MLPTAFPGGVEEDPNGGKPCDNLDEGKETMLQGYD
jgi:hypothetical protein